MVQIIPTQPSILGRLGKGIGEGLSTTVPREIEHYRRTQGLKALAENPSTDPWQNFVDLSSVYGATPQMIQTGGELLKQRAQNNALSNYQTENESDLKFNEYSNLPIRPNSGSDVPSTTTGDLFESVQKGNISPTTNERRSMAAQRFKSNQPRYKNDFNNAIAEVEEEISTNNEIFQQKKAQYDLLQDVADRTKKRLREHSNGLGVNIPENVYSDIENKVIDAIKPKSEGGRGLTEDQAVKEFTKNDLDPISRDYSALESFGDSSSIGARAEDSLRGLKNLQKSFDKRNDTENMADTLIARNVSPDLSYAIAEPVSREPELNKKISSIPDLGVFYSLSRNLTQGQKLVKQKTEKISNELAPLLGKKGSPLAVAFELEKKGYDPEAWMGYLVDHVDELKLTDAQIRQLSKARPIIRSLPDWWYSIWSGQNIKQEKK